MYLKLPKCEDDSLQFRQNDEIFYTSLWKKFVLMLKFEENYCNNPSVLGGSSRFFCVRPANIRVRKFSIYSLFLMFQQGNPNLKGSYLSYPDLSISRWIAFSVNLSQILAIVVLSVSVP
jgi:hypothetical protein